MNLEWIQESAFTWFLCELGEHNMTVGCVSYNSDNLSFSGLWNGSFHTRDGKVIGLNPVGKTLSEAKAQIEHCYYKNNSFEEWLR